MLKHFLSELLWVFLFLLFLFITKYIPTYVYERINLPEIIIPCLSWGGLFLCGLRIAWRMGFSAWWLCFLYSLLISIIVFIYNLLVYKLHQPTDFPEITGGIWLSFIFYILSFSVIFTGFIAGVFLKKIILQIKI